VNAAPNCRCGSSRRRRRAVRIGGPLPLPPPPQPHDTRDADKQCRYRSASSTNQIYGADEGPVLADSEPGQAARSRRRRSGRRTTRSNQVALEPAPRRRRRANTVESTKPHFNVGAARGRAGPRARHSSRYTRNCNVFNAGAFDAGATRQRPDNKIALEHGRAGALGRDLQHCILARRPRRASRFDDHRRRRTTHDTSSTTAYRDDPSQAFALPTIRPAPPAPPHGIFSEIYDPHTQPNSTAAVSGARNASKADTDLDALLGSAHLDRDIASSSLLRLLVYRLLEDN